MKLYIYDHCPYCVKARMIFGLKAFPFKLMCLLNDDEKTPISMIGVKMLPILKLKEETLCLRVWILFLILMNKMVSL